MPDYSNMEAALEFLAPYGPDLSNGLTNHGPMVAEVLCAVGRSDAVLPWLERYRRRGLAPAPPSHQRVERSDWHAALGQVDRSSDWASFFEEELFDFDWRTVLGRWTAALAPGFSASATHGVIRVGHAVRSLAEGESPARLRELAAALGYWAASYGTLPCTPANGRGARPRDALALVPMLPAERRRSAGSIGSSLVALDNFPPFAPVAGLIDTNVPPVELISELTELFARVYLANSHSIPAIIAFVHGVTGIAAVRSILPALGDAAARTLLRYGWQTSCALYAAFGVQPPNTGEIETPRETPETLIDMAISNGDEHVIKLTHACVREYALNRSPAYLAAARHAVASLRD